MVHRSLDSRLLTNLISHEKEYGKQLATLLECSHASITSLTAYAAASPPPASKVILAVSGALSGADEALREYASSVDQWRDFLRQLKDLEDEVGNIMRDREILVTRLLKASKSTEKANSSSRNSLIHRSPSNPPQSPPQIYTSASDISLISDDIPVSTQYASAPAFAHSSSFNAASKKLQAAQAELQACEAHLALKEQELDVKRSGTIREGLHMRCQTLSQCGRRWTELISNLDSQQNDVFRHFNGTEKPLPAQKPCSDLSSIAPSQSASQINIVPEEPTFNTHHMYSEYEASPSPDITPGSSVQHHTPQLNGDPGPSTLEVPGSYTIRHNLPHRITEEDLGFRAGSLGGSSSGLVQADPAPAADVSSDDGENDNAKVVENPRFASLSSSKLPLRLPESKPVGSSPSKIKGRDRKSSIASSGDRGSTGSGGGSKFFGTLKGLFTRHPKSQLNDRENDDDDDSIKRGSKNKGKAWDMRTPRNVKPGGSSPLSNSFEAYVQDGGARRLRKGRGAGKITDAELRARRRSRSLDAIFRNPEVPVPQSQHNEQDHGWTSDSGDLAQASLNRRKSHRKSTPAAVMSPAPSLAPTPSLPSPYKAHITQLVSDFNSGSNLSRNSSLTSAVSAPANMTARRRTTTLPARQNSSQNNLLSPSSKPRALNVDDNMSDSLGKAKTTRSTTKSERRASSPVHLNPSTPTLMSIVEDVARANREGWNPELASKSVGGTLKPLPSSHHARNGSLEVPKAPRSIFDTRQTPIRTPTMETLPSLPLATPTSSNEIPDEMPVRDSRLLQKPLRSALRNPSRSPSPLPIEGLLTSSSFAPFSATNGENSDDDGASISSYETGLETFEDPEEHPPPAPPKENGSDLAMSVSSASTETPAVPEKSHRRRKSVRVSLKPTYSATPPAIDYEEEEVWVDRGQALNNNRNVWEDSSDEDIEYTRAKKLLSR
ncbi:hypothetical protein C8J56DRAFT_918141 [Mycena floridula]|nr:hypothetical protein C8J56DRAFT_918141 [Mycena floridula]